jgi:hypothetical protein
MVLKLELNLVLELELEPIFILFLIWGKKVEIENYLELTTNFKPSYLELDQNQNLI